MSQNTALIAELKHEASLTKKMLEKVPMDNPDWKPHDKSMKIGRLATHIAENPTWITEVLTNDNFDFMAKPFSNHIAADSKELLELFDANINAAIASLEKATDEDFNKLWTAKRADQIMFQSPKNATVRAWAFSHMIHHRGQLSVYLRLLDIPVPGVYGPTADER